MNKDIVEESSEENEILEHAYKSKGETAVNNEEKTVKDVFDTFTEEQKTVVYVLIGQALEDAKSEKEDKLKHSDEIEGGNDTMKHNIFDNDKQTQEHIW